MSDAPPIDRSPSAPWIGGPPRQQVANQRDLTIYGGQPGVDPTVVDHGPEPERQSREQREREDQRAEHRREYGHPMVPRLRLPPTSGDFDRGRDEQAAYIAARDRQLVRAAVAPGCSIQSERGHWIGEGEAVSIGDVWQSCDLVHEDAAYASEQRALIVIDPVELQRRLGDDELVTHRVCEGARVQTPSRSVLFTGCRLGPSDFERPDIPPQPERTEHVQLRDLFAAGAGLRLSLEQTNATVPLTIPARPGQPGIRGQDVIDRLEAEGRIEPIPRGLLQRASGALRRATRRKGRDTSDDHGGPGEAA